MQKIENVHKSSQTLKMHMLLYEMVKHGHLDSQALFLAKGEHSKYEALTIFMSTALYKGH